jgi:hypothetical protein
MASGAERRLSTLDGGAQEVTPCAEESESSRPRSRTGTKITPGPHHCQSSRFGHQSTGSAPGCLVIVVAHCRAHPSLASMSLADSPASINLDRTAASVNEPLIQEPMATNGPPNGALINESGIFRKPVTLGGSVEKMMNLSPSGIRPQRMMKPSDAIVSIQYGDDFAVALTSLHGLPYFLLPSRTVGSV